MEELVVERKDIPIEAYRYWPTNEHIYQNSGKSLVRFIFYKTAFTDFECTQLQNFKAHLKLKHPEFILPSFFGDEELLRVVLGCKYDLKKATAALFNSITWRSINLVDSFRTLFPLCQPLLNSGCMYFHGRDHRYRPLLVINVERLDLKSHSVASYCHLLCFLLEYAIQKLMIPGQIENWIVITDLGSKGLTQLPISEVKSIVKTLQDNFRCRMIVNYVVNAPSSLYFLWGIVKKFIEEHTIKKIRINKETVPEEMKSHFARSQYEEKYGGSAPNATVFWPPCFPPGPVNIEGDAPDKFLTDVNTYDLYNKPLESEISSDLGDISENVRVLLPEPLNLYEIYVNSRKCSVSSKAKSCEEDGQDGEAEIDEEDERKLKESIILTDYEASQIYDRRLSEVNSIPENNQQEFDEPKLEYEDVEVFRIPRNSTAFIVEKPIDEQRSTRSSKFCKFCSKRMCVIY